MIEGHSNDLLLLLAGCAVLAGLYGWCHARRYWEGLPPVLDGFVSMAGFLSIIGAFVLGGRIGGQVGHPHAARVVAVFLAMIAYRTIRTRLGREQERYRTARARKADDS